MIVLLDTHTLLWMLRDDPRLSRDAAAALDAADEVLVSAASAYEVSWKHRLGKLPEVAALVDAFEREIAAAYCTLLPITPAHAIAAGKLDPFHRDPFDRMLVAQALVERVPIISNEKTFDRFGVERVW